MILHFFRVISFILLHRVFNTRHHFAINAWLQHAFVKHPSPDKKKLTDLAIIFYSVNLESKRALKLVHVGKNAFWVLKTARALRALKKSKMRIKTDVGKIFVKVSKGSV